MSTNPRTTRPTRLTRLAVGTAAALAMTASFATTSQARTGELQEGDTGTDGQLSMRVDLTTEPSEGVQQFRVRTCVGAEGSAATTKASDFAVVDLNGVSHATTPIAKPATWAGVGDEAYPAQRTVEAGECIYGWLQATGLTASGSTVSYKKDLISWEMSTSDDDGTVALGQTAVSDQGLSVTLSALTKTHPASYTVRVKACSSTPTQFGWDDITFLEKGTRKRIPVGNHEGDVLGDAALRDTTLSANACVTGLVSFVTENGADLFRVRNLIFTTETPATTASPTPAPTATPSGTPTKPTLPRTGN